MCVCMYVCVHVCMPAYVWLHVTQGRAAAQVTATHSTPAHPIPASMCAHAHIHIHTHLDFLKSAVDLFSGLELGPTTPTGVEAGGGWLDDACILELAGYGVHMTAFLAVENLDGAEHLGPTVHAHYSALQANLRAAREVGALPLLSGTEYRDHGMPFQHDVCVQARHARRSLSAPNLTQLLTRRLMWNAPTSFMAGLRGLGESTHCGSHSRACTTNLTV